MKKKYLGEKTLEEKKKEKRGLLIFPLSHFSRNPGTSSKFLRTMSVRMCPGLMQLTRMPPVPSLRMGLHSMARLRASWITAAFEEL